MKSLLYLTIISLLFSISCSKDETTNTTNPVLPVSTKPVVEIIAPSGNVEVASDNTIAIDIKYTSGVELLSSTITMTADAISGGAYYANTRALNGLTDQITENIPLLDVNLLGNHRISVLAQNDIAEQEFVEASFVLVDNSDPVIQLNEFYTASEFEVGTPESKYNFKVTENYMLKKVTWEIVKTDGGGNAVSQLYENSKDFSVPTKEFIYNEVFEAMADSEGVNYKGIITVEDVAGNVAIWTSNVMQL